MKVFSCDEEKVEVRETARVGPVGVSAEGRSSARQVLAQNGMKVTRSAISYRTIICTDPATI